MLAALELVVPVLARRNPRRAKTRAMSERASITPRNSSLNCGVCRRQTHRRCVCWQALLADPETPERNIFFR